MLARRSLYGALAVAVVFGVVAFGFKWLSEVLPTDDGFTAGTPYPVSADVSIVPADGWRRDASKSSIGGQVQATYGPGTLVATIGTGTLSAAEARERKTLLGENSKYRVSPSKAFTTDAGVKGRTFLAQSVDKTVRAWVLVDGPTAVTIEGSAVPPRFASVNGDLQDMAESTTFSAGA